MNRKTLNLNQKDPLSRRTLSQMRVKSGSPGYNRFLKYNRGGSEELHLRWVGTIQGDAPLSPPASSSFSFRDRRKRVEAPVRLRSLDLDPLIGSSWQ